MSIKLYSTRVRPDDKVAAVETRSDQRISQGTATQIGNAFKQFGQAAEDAYVTYEKSKAENEIIEKQDQILYGEKDDQGNVIYEGLGNAKNRLSASTKMDEVGPGYDKVFNSIKSRFEPQFKSRIAKKLFNNFLNKQKISDMAHIRRNVYNNFNQETGTLLLKKTEPLKAILASQTSVPTEKEIARYELNQIFNSDKFKMIFAGKAKATQFQIEEDIEVLKFDVDYNTNPLTAFTKIKDPKQYPNMSDTKRVELTSKARRAAKAYSNREIAIDAERAESGIASKMSKEELLSPFIGTDEYAQKESILGVNEIVRKNYNNIKNAKYGEASSVIEKITVEGENIKYKKQANIAIDNILAKKQKAINSDAAGYYSKNDDDLIILDKEIKIAEQSGDVEKRNLKIQEKSNLLEEIYKENNVPVTLRTYISKKEADSFINNYNAVSNPDQKIGLMMDLKNKYQNKSSAVLKYLIKNKLPTEAAMLLTTNSSQLHRDIVLGNDEQLKTNLKTTLGYKKSDFDLIDTKIYNKMEDYFDVLKKQSPNRNFSEEFINETTKNLANAVYSRMFYRKESQSTAITNVTSAYLSDYQLADSGTYFIPTDVNGVSVNQQVIEAKANYVKQEIEFGNYLDKIDLSKFQSSNKLMSPDASRKIIVDDIKNNSNWYLNSEGDGIVLAVTRSDTGKIIPIVDAKSGKKLEIKFTDATATMPITGRVFGYEELDFVRGDQFNEMNP